MRMRDTDRDENTEASHETTALHLISFLKSFYALTNRFVSLLLLYVAKESTLGVLNSVAGCTAVAKLLRFFKTLKKTVHRASDSRRRCPPVTWYPTGSPTATLNTPG